MNISALIVAAGTGSRMGSEAPKVFLSLAGRPLLAHSLETFESHRQIGAIIVMAASDRLEAARTIADGFSKLRAVAPGGPRRQDTVRLGLTKLAELGLAGPDDLVLIHDAARPLVEAGLISDVVRETLRIGAAVPAIAAADTLRRVTAGTGAVSGGVLPRDEIVLTQTPQGFRVPLILEAFERAGSAEVTDDAALVELIGRPVAVVSGSARNIKITRPHDLALAQALLHGGEA